MPTTREHNKSTTIIPRHHGALYTISRKIVRIKKENTEAVEHGKSYVHNNNTTEHRSNEKQYREALEHGRSHVSGPRGTGALKNRTLVVAVKNTTVARNIARRYLSSRRTGPERHELGDHHGSPILRTFAPITVPTSNERRGQTCE